MVIIGAFSRSLINFRGTLINTLSKSACNVIAMSGTDEDTSNYKIELEDLGAKYISYPVSRNSLNPIRDFETLLSLVIAFRKVKPKKMLA
ncbi:glycosyltransferase family 1 protein, partial [Vibrio parahaemolyticus]